MSINRLYHTWLDYIRQLYPGERITRLRNLACLLVGIYCSKSVHLSQIAVHIPGAARSLGIVRRLSRFLDNPAVRVRNRFSLNIDQDPGVGFEFGNDLATGNYSGCPGKRQLKLHQPLQSRPSATGS